MFHGDGKQSRDFTYVANVVHGNLLAADAENVGGQILNMANGRSTDLLTLIEQLQELLDVNLEPVHQPARIGDVRESMADITMAITKLGYLPQVAFDTGLRKSIEYYRSIVNVS